MDPFPENWERAAAVAAHPDDLEYGAAAAIARWTAQGKSVAYVLATRGEAGIDGIAPDEAGPLRVDEERRSAAVVGVTDVSFLDYQDGNLEYGLPLRRDLAIALRRLRPEIVITLNFDLTWGGDVVNQADHRALGLALLDACRDAGNRWIFSDAGEPWSGVDAVYVAASPEPTHFVDVTATIDNGLASLREHKAYLDGLGGDFDHIAFLRDLAKQEGEKVGCAFATTFRLLRV
jgi:LmbE family N-acetylglucosaminyl deacetylase